MSESASRVSTGKTCVRRLGSGYRWYTDTSMGVSTVTVDG